MEGLLEHQRLAFFFFLVLFYFFHVIQGRVQRTIKFNFLIGKFWPRFVKYESSMELLIANMDFHIVQMGWPDHWVCSFGTGSRRSLVLEKNTQEIRLTASRLENRDHINILATFPFKSFWGYIGKSTYSVRQIQERSITACVSLPSQTPIFF